MLNIDNYLPSNAVFKIIRGTIDVEDSADIEYQMSNFTNAAKTKTPMWLKPIDYFI